MCKWHGIDHKNIRGKLQINSLPKWNLQIISKLRHSERKKNCTLTENVPVHDFSQGTILKNQLQFVKPWLVNKSSGTTTTQEPKRHLFKWIISWQIQAVWVVSRALQLWEHHTSNKLMSCATHDSFLKGLISPFLASYITLSALGFATCYKGKR